MKNTILYFTFLFTTNISPIALAQNRHINTVDWRIAAQIPAVNQQAKNTGLAGAISGTYQDCLLVAGGTNFPGEMPWNGGKKKYYDEVFLYQKTAEGLMLISPKSNLKLPFALAYAAVCSMPGGIVVAGGENETGLSKKAFILRPQENGNEMKYLPDLPKGLTNAALTVVGETLYLAGGETEEGATAQFLALDLQKQEEGWIKQTSLPQPVSHLVLLALESGNQKEIFLVGGRKRNDGDTSTIYKDVFAFNVEQQVWGTKKSLPYALSAACGIVEGNQILVFSGDRGEAFHQAEKLIAEIGREKDAHRKELLNQRKAELQSNHPGFSKAVLSYDPLQDSWLALKSDLPYGTVTTNAVVLDHQVIIAGGEIKAGIRTPKILIGQLKSAK